MRSRVQQPRAHGSTTTKRELNKGAARSTTYTSERVGRLGKATRCGGGVFKDRRRFEDLQPSIDETRRWLASPNTRTKSDAERRAASAPYGKTGLCEHRAAR